MKSLPSFRKVLAGLLPIIWPLLIGVGFAVQAINPVTELGRAICFFWGAAIGAVVFVWVWNEILEFSPGQRIVILFILGGLACLSFWFAVEWLNEKADEVAHDTMVRNLHDGASDVIQIKMYDALKNQKSAGIVAPPTEPKSATIKPRPLLNPPSFPFVVPGVWIATGGWDFIVNHRGKEASLHIEILFTDKIRQEQVLIPGKQSLSPEELNSYQRLYKFSEIDPKGQGSIYATQFLWSPPTPEHEKYSIDATWRDGRTHQ